jgi:hypothetical protein
MTQKKDYNYKLKVTLLKTHLSSCRSIITDLFFNVNEKRYPSSTRDTLNEMRKTVCNLEYKLSEIKNYLQKD